MTKTQVYVYEDLVNEVASFVVHRPGKAPSCAVLEKLEYVDDFVEWFKVDEPNVEVHRFTYCDHEQWGEKVINDEGMPATRIDTCPPTDAYWQLVSSG